MNISSVTDRRTAVFGFGVEGRAAVDWLRRCGLKAEKVVAPSRPDDLPDGVSFAAESDLQSLDGIDLLVRSPGIPPSHPLLVEAARRGIEMTTGTSLFVDVVRGAGIPVIGVTGSKGKSTTSMLIHLALDEAGVGNVLVGNIGRAALDSLEEVLDRRPVVVYEMSSYQAHDLAHGPSVSLITRLFPEHIDWHGSVESYYRAKLNIARTQGRNDVTIWNASDPTIAARLPLGPARHVPYGAGDGVHVSAGVFRRGDTTLFDDRGMRLRGIHNRLNACAAFTAAEIFGASPRDMRAVLESFSGLPHRLEDLGVHGGVRWINDSISTAPEAAVAALEAFPGEVATYIGGGTDRGFDFSPLARALDAGKVENVILVPPGGARMAEAIGRRARIVANLEEAVATAARLTPAGGIALFSPASPSYGTFRNFEERGDRLRSLVAGL